MSGNAAMIQPFASWRTVRIDAARARIKRAVEYLDTIAADSPYDKFASQRMELRQALDLLNPEVKLA